MKLASGLIGPHIRSCKVHGNAITTFKLSSRKAFVGAGQVSFGKADLPSYDFKDWRGSGSTTDKISLSHRPSDQGSKVHPLSQVA